jgi:FAD binding domain-containing protein
MKIISDPAELAPFSEDYGRQGAQPPRLVVKPRDAAEVQRAVQMARDQGLTIRARSGGHGLEGQSLNRGGMVIATDDMVLPSGQRIELDRAANLVRLVPSLRTGEVATFLAPLGLRLPSTTMDGFPGMGGAVSTAGIGHGSHRHGSLADQVIELAAVIGTGEHLRVHSSRRDYADFGDNAVANFIPGGLGQAGVITELAFPVVPISGTLRLFRQVHASAGEMAQALQAQLDASEPDAVAVWGTVAKSPNTGHLVYLTSCIRDVRDASAGDPVVSAGDPGADPEVLPAWLDLIYPSLPLAMRALEAHPELLTNLLQMPGMVLVIPQKKVCPDRLTLNAWPKARQGDMMLALGVFYYLGRAQASVVVKDLRATRDHAIANLGAQPYFMDGLPHDWRPLLGDERLARVQTVLDRADPHRVFARLPGL